MYDWGLAEIFVELRWYVKIFHFCFAYDCLYLLRTFPLLIHDNDCSYSFSTFRIKMCSQKHSNGDVYLRKQYFINVLLMYNISAVNNAKANNEREVDLILCCANEKLDWLVLKAFLWAVTDERSCKGYDRRSWHVERLLNITKPFTTPPVIWVSCGNISR